MLQANRDLQIKCTSPDFLKRKKILLRVSTGHILKIHNKIIFNKNPHLCKMRIFLLCTVKVHEWKGGSFSCFIIFLLFKHFNAVLKVPVLVSSCNYIWRFVISTAIIIVYNFTNQIIINPDNFVNFAFGQHAISYNKYRKHHLE